MKYCLGLWLGMLVAAVPAYVFADSPATTTASATTQSADGAPTTTTTVKTGTVRQIVDLEGVFEPIDPFEVKIRPKQYQGDLTILSTAANGASVKKGDVLLEVDSRTIKQDEQQADSDLAVAKANLVKAQADSTLGDAGDDLALKIAQRGVDDAQKNVEWWDKVDGPESLQGADLSVKAAREQVDDQQDELDQLKKMYKTDDLSNATSDIVVKRAVRALENSNIQLKMTVERADKTKVFQTPQARQQVVDALDQAKQSLAQLKATQDQQKVQRSAALTTAQIALAKAQQKSDEIKADVAMFVVKAPFDGVLLYGQLSAGAWQPLDAKTIKPGEKIAPGQVIATVYAPGKLRVGVDVPEMQEFWVKPGEAATVTAEAIPDHTYHGPIAFEPGRGAQGIRMIVDVGAVDDRLAPGMKAKVRVEGHSSEGLVVPLSAVQGGKVRVRQPDGSEVSRDVDLGLSDGEKVIVEHGLVDGDEVLTDSGK